MRKELQIATLGLGLMAFSGAALADTAKTDANASADVKLETSNAGTDAQTEATGKDAVPTGTATMSTDGTKLKTSNAGTDAQNENKTMVKTDAGDVPMPSVEATSAASMKADTSGKVELESSNAGTDEQDAQEEQKKN